MPLCNLPPYLPCTVSVYLPLLRLLWNLLLSSSYFLQKQAVCCVFVGVCKCVFTYLCEVQVEGEGQYSLSLKVVGCCFRLIS